MRPLDQNLGGRGRPIRPPSGYVHVILAAVWGSWYNLGHNLYQLPLNG